MKTMKKIFAAVMLVVLCLTASSGAFAATSGPTTEKCNLRQGTGTKLVSMYPDW